MLIRELGWSTQIDWWTGHLSSLYFHHQHIGWPMCDFGQSMTVTWVFSKWCSQHLNDDPFIPGVGIELESPCSIQRSVWLTSHHNDHYLMGQSLREKRIYFGSQLKNMQSTIARWHGDRGSSVLGANQGTEKVSLPFLCVHSRALAHVLKSPTSKMSSLSSLNSFSANICLATKYMPPRWFQIQARWCRRSAVTVWESLCLWVSLMACLCKWLPPTSVWNFYICVRSRQLKMS